ncbi:MAG TPA: SAM-dependent methyltransferase [Micromonosporaceae bacterium]|nr:SAM-dependent methyltransferase [Micromonosporaceae bacterium]
MPEPLDAAVAEIRALLLDPGTLIRAVAAGRRRGSAPRWVRAQLRPVDLKAGRHLQIVTDDGTRPATRNVAPGAPAEAAVDELLAEPYGNWHVESTTATVQLRVTKSGAAQVHRAPRTASSAAPAGAAGTSSAAGPGAHDRTAAHLLDPGDPLFDVVGGTAAKRRQVDAFLRSLAATLDDDATQPGRRLRVVDLGCGNAYLTFAAYRYLSGRGLDVEVTGIDVRADQRDRNSAVAERLGCADRVRFVAGTIAGSTVDDPPDLVLALHACDTATDEALARAVAWQARWVLAAPCCHHDVGAQLRAGPAPAPYQALTRHAILRERFADVLTDSLRAGLLRLHGYRVDVVEFVDSAHTPRNLLLRARRTGAAPTEEHRAEYRDLVGAWRVTPMLATLLQPETPGRSAAASSE